MPEAQDLASPPSADALSPPTAAHDLAASRRTFLAGTGVLALAATAGATTVASFAPAGTGSPEVDDAIAALGEPGTVIALVRAGESTVTVLSGENEVEVTDAALAAAITRKVR